MCKIEDANRITHVEYQNVAVLTESERLQNQRHSLRNRHKKPGDFRVRDGDAAFFFDLFFEYRNHAALRTQDISKPHGHAAHMFFWSGCQNELPQPLGGAHETSGLHSLVGRNQNKSFTTTLLSDVKQRR